MDTPPSQIQVAAHPLPHGMIALECSECGMLGIWPAGTGHPAAVQHLHEEHGVPIP